MTESRTSKSVTNAIVNFVAYFLMLIVAFFSRKIFLDTLGPEFIGLSGTLQNILMMLSLAELGIGVSISFHLYKPIKEHDICKISELLSLFGWFYRMIGSLIFVIAIIISLFFPIIFSNSEINITVAVFVFYCFLCSSLIGYFINYKQILLTADQKDYVVKIYIVGGQILKTLLQMYLCKYYCDYYLWAVVELLFSIFSCIVINIKIKKLYPWLNSQPKLGFKLYKQNPNIIKSAKQIFIHKIKDFLLKQSDQIFVFAFVSLKMVAYYGNYAMLVQRITQLIGSVLDSVSAGVGNLVAEGNKQRIISVFWELMSIRYFVAGYVSVCLYYIIPSFIKVWIGADFLLSDTVTILICINLFIQLSRNTVDNYNHAYGQYADIWAAWAEGGINIAVTLVAGTLWGIAGILLGKIVSVFFIVILWKPYYLFRDGFHDSYFKYWRYTIVYYLLIALSVMILQVAMYLYPVDSIVSWNGFIKYSSFIAVIYGISYLLLMYVFGRGFRDFVGRFIKIKVK